mmetsp:Transcript_96737/g.282810  ORF Transcript_96737/g.282810 Transcript_96737/m.282810 type:complete len:764 (+) Transcript_96737:119-2410(+)
MAVQEESASEFVVGTGDPVFYRSYSRRKSDGHRESYAEVIARAAAGIAVLGDLDEEESALVLQQARLQRCLPSGRWLWVGGTEWIKDSQNFSGAYNCTSMEVDEPAAFGMIMELAMMGCGTGAVLERRAVDRLPVVRNALAISRVVPVSAELRGRGETVVVRGATRDILEVSVGDSRQGWTDAYQAFIDMAFDSSGPPITYNICLDLSEVRRAGAPLKGFGGTANPIKLEEMFRKVASLLSEAQGRKLTSIECSLLIDEAAACVVAGNIRRSAGMRQFSSDDTEAAIAKQNLYTQVDGVWRVDPKREALRMANHTRVFHRKPTFKELKEAVSSQYHSGEGAIQYAPEAIARANVDLWRSPEDRVAFLEACEECRGAEVFRGLMKAAAPNQDEAEREFELTHRMHRYGLNPCGEIIGSDFHCNLAEVHLPRLEPRDAAGQAAAFRAAGLQAAALLRHRFASPRHRASRDLDPIVGVSFTGLFDFFVCAFGRDWLKWQIHGRPTEGDRWSEEEAHYLQSWREVAESTVAAYCTRHGLKAPNRCTTVQPAGTKSLLTGASAGWHPPKSVRYIRRITFSREDPIALACRECGYFVIPAPSAHDEDGQLLTDIWDDRVQEWLVEIPMQVPWHEVAEGLELSAIPARAQFLLCMQVQRHYATHNTSATIELREAEIDELAELIHGHLGHGYISMALLARFDTSATFPRMPVEPISQSRFEVEVAAMKARRRCCSFVDALRRFDDPKVALWGGASGCDSEACGLPACGGA